MVDPIESGNNIVRSMRRIIRQVSLHSRHLAREAGLTLPQVLCLRALASAPKYELTVNALGASVELSGPTVSGIADRLERQGLVRRERWESDRRKVSVRLTDTGRDALANLPPSFQEQFVAKLIRLDADVRAQLEQNLELLVTLLEAEEVDAAPILIADADMKR